MKTIDIWTVPVGFNVLLPHEGTFGVAKVVAKTRAPYVEGSDDLNKSVTISRGFGTVSTHPAHCINVPADTQVVIAKDFAQ